MANDKEFKGRIQHKHDVEANWLLATNFTPKAGELIIYDVDSTHNQPRLKIGDGTTKVNALPFSNYSIDEINSMIAPITNEEIDTICSQILGESLTTTQIETLSNNLI